VRAAVFVFGGVKKYMEHDFVGLRSREKIVFWIKKKLFDTLYDWVDQLDDEVYQQQVETGSYYGKWLVDDCWFELNEWRKANGKRTYAYFGASAATGLVARELVFTVDGVALQGEHVIADEPFRVMIALNQVCLIESTELSNLESPAMRDDQYRYVIDGKMLNKLLQWPYWIENDAFSGRYVYRFSGTTLGLVTKIIDHEQNEMIDVTDYSTW